MHQYFFSETLQNTGSRIAVSNKPANLLLDKNEQSCDVDMEFKNQLINSLLDANWNRYPSADCKDVEQKVAEYCGLNTENIVLSPGSATLITTLLNYFALNKKHIVIAQPTYTLFDYHCKTFNIDYEPWLLTADLEYNYDCMPVLGPGSVLIVTTPNNPVGNTIEASKLEQILTENPEAYIIVDGVYTEFGGTDFSPLVKKYENLIVLRSFSKAFPIAGLRFGYMCAAPQTASIIRKLMLPFSINHFSLVFAREVLFNPAFMECSKQQVKTIIYEREKMYRMISNHFENTTLKVFKSAGNFLLIRIFKDANFQKVLSGMEQNGIKVLNSSPFPLLQNTFRVSVGTTAENDFFIRCLSASLESEQKKNFQLPTVHTPNVLVNAA